MDSLCCVISARPDQLPLAVLQAETWRRNPFPGHVRRVQGIPPTKLGWLTSLCRHLLGRAQEELLAPVRGSLWLSSPTGALASDSPRVWSRCNSKKKGHNPMLYGRPETFCPGPVGCLRPWPKLLEKGRGGSCQCRDKGNAPILLQYLRHRLEVFEREQAC